MYFFRDSLRFISFGVGFIMSWVKYCELLNGLTIPNQMIHTLKHSVRSLFESIVTQLLSVDVLFLWSTDENLIKESDSKWNVIQMPGRLDKPFYFLFVA